MCGKVHNLLFEMKLLKIFFRSKQLKYGDKVNYLDFCVQTSRERYNFDSFICHSIKNQFENDLYSNVCFNSNAVRGGITLLIINFGLCFNVPSLQNSSSGKWGKKYQAQLVASQIFQLNGENLYEFVFRTVNKFFFIS